MSANPTPQEIPQQTPQPANPTANPSSGNTLEDRIAVVEDKRRKFMKILKIFLIIVGAFIFVSIATSILIKLYNEKRQLYVKPAPIEKPDTGSGNGNDIEKWETYQSDLFKLSLEYPETAESTESEKTTNDPMKLEIKAGNEREGYAFSVTLLDTPNISFYEIANIKKSAYQASCPSTAIFSDVYDGLVDTIDAKIFTIQNCDGDYTVTFVPRFGNYYELTQKYWGDLGYRQKYATYTQKILKSISFYEIETPPEDPYIRFWDKQTQTAFTHPRLDGGCCSIPGVSSETLRFIVTFADSDTVVDNETFDGFGVFYEPSTRQAGSIGDYVTIQKDLLVSTYKITTGNSPVTEEAQIKVGGVDAVLLKGYSWRGNDLIMLDLPNKNGYLIISVNDISGEFYEKTLNDVLASFEFGVRE